MERYPLYEWACSKYGKEKVKERIAKILDDCVTDNGRTIKSQMIINSTLKRLNGLAIEDKNIEYIDLGSPLVENALQRLITSYDFIVNGLLALTDFDAPLKVKTHIQNDSNALGSLINELHRFSENEKLFSLLSNFNGHRKQATHKMFEDEHDIEIVNQKLRSYVQSDPIRIIISEVVKEHASLQERLINRLGEYGMVPSNEPPDLSAAMARMKRNEKGALGGT